VQGIAVKFKFESVYQQCGVKVLSFKGKPPAKRNAAVEKNNGEIMGFIDSDAIAERSWVNKAVHGFMFNKKAVVIGGPNLAPESSFLGNCQSYERHRHSPSCYVYVP